MESNVRFLITFVGIPRSGKTTFRKKLISELSGLGKEVKVISPDEMRLEIYGERFNQQKDYLVWNKVKEYKQDLSRNGLADVVIFDATSITPAYRKELINDFPNFIHIAVYFDTELEVCKERAIMTNQKDLIPVIDRMGKSITPPTTKEGFDWVFTHCELDKLISIISD